MANDALVDLNHSNKKRGCYFVIFSTLDVEVLEKALRYNDLIDYWCYATHLNAYNENSNFFNHHHVLIHTNRIVLANTVIHSFYYPVPNDYSGNIIEFGNSILRLDNDSARAYHNYLLIGDEAIYYSSKEAVNFWMMCGKPKYGYKEPK